LIFVYENGYFYNCLESLGGVNAYDMFIDSLGVDFLALLFYYCRCCLFFYLIL